MTAPVKEFWVPIFWIFFAFVVLDILSNHHKVYNSSFLWCIRRQGLLSGIVIDALSLFEIPVMVEQENKQACTFKDSYCKAQHIIGILFFDQVVIDEFIEKESNSISELIENEDYHKRALFFLEIGSCLPFFL